MFASRCDVGAVPAVAHQLLPRLFSREPLQEALEHCARVGQAPTLHDAHRRSG